jgi:hypothetical protein
MADTKITALTECTDVQGDDLLAVVDQSGTPATKKATVANVVHNPIIVAQASHGLAVGDVIKVTGANTYAKAQADTAANAEVVGVVSVVVDSGNFHYIPFGLMKTGVPAVAAGTVLFLSDSTAGLLTSTAPTETGHILKPLAVVLENAVSMMVVNFRGVMIAGGAISLHLKIIDDLTSLATGDGAILFCISSDMNGMNLVDADAYVTTVSSSGLPTIQLRNVTDSCDMLSVKISIDATEFTSYTATTAPTINTTYDDVATGDIIAIDVDVAGTGTKGLGVILVFQNP